MQVQAFIKAQPMLLIGWMNGFGLSPIPICIPKTRNSLIFCMRYVLALFIEREMEIHMIFLLNAFI